MRVILCTWTYLHIYNFDSVKLCFGDVIFTQVYNQCICSLLMNVISNAQSPETTFDNKITNFHY